MIIAFELTMPNVNTWNGRWTGEDNLYIEFKTLPKETGERIKNKNYHYNFGDGWATNIKVYQVDGNTKRKLERKSKGFMGYEWMINSIIFNGEIKYEDDYLS